MSDTTTNGIRVQVTTKYLPERSSPRENEYWFAYFIRISNVGTETAKLLGRHWVITNADGEEEEVRGDGVVGGTFTSVLRSRTPPPSMNCGSRCRIE